MPKRSRLRRFVARPCVAALTFLVGLPFAGCTVAPAPETAVPVAIGGPAVVLDGKRHLEYRVGVNIKASPSTVWEILTDAGNYPEWNSTVIALGGVIAQGEKITLVSTVDPKRKFKLTVTTFEPNRKLVWEDGGKSFRGVRTFTLTENEDGSTDVTMVEALGGTMMGMIEKQLPDFRPSFDAFAKDLKAEAERRAQGG